MGGKPHIFFDIYNFKAKPIHDKMKIFNHFESQETILPIIKNLIPASFRNLFEDSEKSFGGEIDVLDYAKKLFGLDNNFTKRDLKKAFRRKAMQLHPDKRAGQKKSKQEEYDLNTELVMVNNAKDYLNSYLGSYDEQSDGISIEKTKKGLLSRIQDYEKANDAKKGRAFLHKGNKNWENELSSYRKAQEEEARKREEERSREEEEYRRQEEEYRQWAEEEERREKEERRRKEEERQRAEELKKREEEEERQWAEELKKREEEYRQWVEEEEKRLWEEEEKLRRETSPGKRRETSPGKRRETSPGRRKKKNLFTRCNTIFLCYCYS